MNADITPVQETVPAELKARPRWVCWRAVERNGRQTKVPFRPDGSEASSTDPGTWSSFDACWAAYAAGGFDGVGFVFTEEDGLVGIDLDNCRGQDGRLVPWAEQWVERFATYTENSPSGTGVKLWLRGTNPFGRGRKKTLVGEGVGGGDAAVEMYSSGRYFAVTGRVLDGHTQIAEADEALKAFTTGVSLRYQNGMKRSVEGSKAGLYIPLGWEKGSPVVIGEGFSDTASLYDWCFPAVGRMSAQSGTGEIQLFVKTYTPSDIIIVADRGEAGDTGARRLANRLTLDGMGVVRVVLPPEPYQDIREWKLAGATADDLGRLIAAAPSVLRRLPSRRSRWYPTHREGVENAFGPHGGVSSWRSFANTWEILSGGR